jgi:hypothetical protein
MFMVQLLVKFRFFTCETDGRQLDIGVTLIINIYGLRVGISTIKNFISGRGWGMTPWGLSYKGELGNG